MTINSFCNWELYWNSVDKRLSEFFFVFACYQTLPYCVYTIALIMRKIMGFFKGASKFSVIFGVLLFGNNLEHSVEFQHSSRKQRKIVNFMVSSNHRFSGWYKYIKNQIKVNNFWKIEKKLVNYSFISYCQFWLFHNSLHLHTIIDYRIGDSKFKINSDNNKQKWWNDNLFLIQIKSRIKALTIFFLALQIQIFNWKCRLPIGYQSLFMPFYCYCLQLFYSVKRRHRNQLQLQMLRQVPIFLVRQGLQSVVVRREKGGPKESVEHLLVELHRDMCTRHGRSVKLYNKQHSITHIAYSRCTFFP